MSPEDVVAKIKRCDLCRAHDDHDHCEINWEYLQEWMERVERALTDVRGTR